MRTRGGRVRPLDGGAAVLAAAVAVELAVLALLPRVVTTDGPGHLLGGWVMAHADDPFLSRFYEVDPTPVPNLLATVLLAALMQVASPDLAEKLLVAGYVVLLPLGLRYALRGVDARAGWLAVAAVPFTFGYLYYYGFYNFCLGVALSLLVAGLALRRRDGWTWRSAAGLCALVLLTWTAHLLPALVAGLLVAVLAVSRAAAQGRPRGPALRRHVLPPALAGLPVLLLTVAFAGSDAARRGAPERDSLLALVFDLVTLNRPLVAYSHWELVPAGALAAALGWLLVRARRRWRDGQDGPERTALLVTALLVTAGYFASPQRYGPEYGFLNDRISTFPPLLLLLWAAGPPPSASVRRRGVALALGAAAVLAAVRAPTELRYQRDVAELMSVAPHVPRGSVLLKVQLWRDPPGGGRVRNPYRDALRHAMSRLAVLTGSVDAGHYEAVLPYFPVRFRPEANPRRVVDPTGRGLWRVPPDVDLVDVGPGPRPDVVVVLGRDRAAPQALTRPAAVRVLGQLERRYRRVAVSERTGLAEVWVPRVALPAAPSSERGSSARG